VSKNKFNANWIAQHINDPYVKLAQKHGYRARAAFKLREIDESDKLIKPGSTVVDLGSTPGAWSQVLREKMARPGEQGIFGKIIALDLLPMEHIADVEFIQGDFRDQAIYDQLETSLNGAKVDLVVSDMAPNLSGVGIVDAARMSDLVELAVQFCRDHLKPNGVLLVKCFHGSGYNDVLTLFKANFVQVAPRKPKASRDKSAETYLLGRGLKAKRAN
jgi:23S rRNA (uridine2552-2'-O)-methyltransferase